MTQQEKEDMLKIMVPDIPETFGPIPKRERPLDKTSMSSQRHLTLPCSLIKQLDGLITATRA